MFNKVITNEIFGAMTDSEKQCKAECEIYICVQEFLLPILVDDSLLPILVDEKIQADVTAPFILWL